MDSLEYLYLLGLEYRWQEEEETGGDPATSRSRTLLICRKILISNWGSIKIGKPLY